MIDAPPTDGQIGWRGFRAALLAQAPYASLSLFPRRDQGHNRLGRAGAVLGAAHEVPGLFFSTTRAGPARRRREARSRRRSHGVLTDRPVAERATNAPSAPALLGNDPSRWRNPPGPRGPRAGSARTPAPSRPPSSRPPVVTPVHERARSRRSHAACLTPRHAVNASVATGPLALALLGPLSQIRKSSYEAGYSGVARFQLPARLGGKEIK
ncbi:unnamed protein product [Lampetra planeri]